MSPGFDKTLICISCTGVFKIGASVGLEVYAAATVKIGVPDALEFEKKLWGEDNLKVKFWHKFCDTPVVSYHCWLQKNIAQKHHIQLAGEVKPVVSLLVFAELGIGVPLLSLSLGLEITVLAIGLPVVIAYNFNTKMSCIGVYMTMSALSGRFYFKIAIGPCPFCAELDVTIFDWEGPVLPTVTIAATGCCHNACTPQCQGGICDRATGSDCLCYLGYVGRTFAEATILSSSIPSALHPFLPLALYLALSLFLSPIVPFPTFHSSSSSQLRSI